jgi:hypothetical protein
MPYLEIPDVLEVPDVLIEDTRTSGGDCCTHTYNKIPHTSQSGNPRL